MQQNNRIEQMHKAKIQRWDKRELGMQLGQTMNKAVDLAIAEGKIEPENILSWRDWMLKEQRNIMDEILEQENGGEEDNTDFPTQ